MTDETVPGERLRERAMRELIGEWTRKARSLSAHGDWPTGEAYATCAAGLQTVLEADYSMTDETPTRCKCGHGKQMHAERCASLLGCDCPAFTPAPSPSPRDELADALEAWGAWHAMSVGLLHELSGRERDETIWRSAWAAARAGRNA